MSDEPSDLKFERSEEFVSLYANNVRFESSVWDFKLVFGELEQGKGDALVEQHTAITLSWPQTKVLAYFLTINTLIHQSQNGHVHIPNSVKPPRPDPGNTDLDPAGRAVFEYLAWIHDQFFGSDPYVPPSAQHEIP